MQPSLSLCIPTYNRSPLLGEALKAILSQWEEAFTGRIELIVCDNASTDDTAKVLQQIAAEYTDFPLQVYRAAENQGPDANIYRAVKMAQGTFVYILSDDDLLLPGALKKLLMLIEAFPNLDGFGLNIRSFQRNSQKNTTPWFSETEDTIILDRNEVLLRVNLLFLSVIAFRRSMICERNYQSRIGTNLLQSYIFLDILANGRGILVTAEPYLAQRQENTGGWNFFRVMTTNTRDLLTHAETLGFSSAAITTWLSRHLRTQIVTSVLHFKLTGHASKLAPDASMYHDAISRLREIYGFNLFLWFVLFPLMLIPERLIQGLRDIYHVIRPQQRQFDK